MSGFRNTLWLLPLILASTWFVWGGAVKRFLAPPSSNPAAIVSYDERHQGFVMLDVVFSQEGTKDGDWEIRAARLFSPEVDPRIQFERVEAEFRNDSGKGFHITGRDGTYDPTRKILYLAGDVVGTSLSDAFEIHSPAVTYDEEAGLISSSDGIRVEGKGARVSGQNLEYEMQTGRYAVSGSVRFETL